MNRKWIVPRCRDFNRSSRQSRIYVAGGCDVISCLTSMMRGHLKSEELYFIFCYELDEQLQLKWSSFVSKSRLFNLWWKIYDIKRQRQQNILDQTLWNNCNVITNRDLLSLTFEMRSLTRRCSDWCSAHSALLAPATSSAPCPPRRPANGAASSCGRPSPAPTAWPSCLHQPGRCELQRCHGYIADCAGTPSGSPHKGQRSSHEADRQTDRHTDRSNQPELRPLVLPWRWCSSPLRGTTTGGRYYPWVSGKQNRGTDPSRITFWAFKTSDIQRASDTERLCLDSLWFDDVDYWDFFYGLSTCIYDRKRIWKNIQFLSDCYCPT